MPDPDKNTISATEASALFNASPYVTRWMLYQKFANGLNIEKPADARISWGKKMQPLILAQVAEEKKLEVIPNHGDEYVRRGLLGCTRDAVIVCPDRGPGALEIKCVFDYETWMTKWQGGAHVPRHNEIQLQTQMYVGDGDEKHYQWGIIAVWVCAEVFYFERQPIPNLWSSMIDAAASFFDHVERKIEPPAFGLAVESPFLAAMYPTKPDSVLDLSADPDHVRTAEDVSMFRTMKEQATGADRVAESLRLKLLALAKDAEHVKLPCGVSYRVRKSGKGRTVVPYVPEVLSPPPAAATESTLAAG